MTENKAYKVTIDGNTYACQAGTPYADIVRDVQPDYEHDILLVNRGGKLRELHRVLNRDCALSMITATDKPGYLGGTGLDKHEIVHDTTQVVGLVGIFRLLIDILGILVGHGLGKELVGHEKLEETLPLLSAMLILHLQIMLYQLWLEM